jgi:hypothetical protein
MATRPLFDIIADFTTGPPGIPGAKSVSLNTSGALTQDWQTRRGRQYELGNAEAGALTLTMFDPKEVINPVNAASPWNTGGNSLLPYRCVQVVAWWNTGTLDLTGNMLNSGNPIAGQPTLSASYGWDCSFESWFVQQLNTGATTFATSTDHLDGSHTVWKCTVGAAANSIGWVPRLVAGSTYTLTIDVWAATGQAITVGWNGATPTTTAVTGNNAFQTATITFTPTAADLTTPAVPYVLAPSGSFPVTFYVSNIQLAGRQPGWSSTGSPTTTYATVAPNSGQYHLSVSVPAGANTVTAPLWTVPGVTYTVSAYVEAVAAGTVVTLAVGGASATTTTTGSYQRLTATFKATNAITTLQFSATGTSYPALYYVDDMQQEMAPVASAFTSAGPTRATRYTGYIERYPQTWTDAGFRGMKPLEAVDALSVLSRTVINQSYQATILADNPTVYIPYNDAALPQTVIRPNGGSPFLGYQNLGTQGSVNFAGDTFLDGSPAVSITQQNTSPPTIGNTAYMTHLYAFNGAVTLLPSGSSLEFWVRPTSGLAYFGAASVPPSENILTEPLGPAYYLGWVSLAGKLYPHYTDPNGGSIEASVGWPNGQPTYPDGNWHQLVVMLASNKLYISIDGNPPGSIGMGFTPSSSLVLNNFFVMAQTDYGDPISQVSFANAAFYPQKLTNAQLAAHYNRGAGYINELSGARIARLLATYWQGPSTVAPGYIRMAPDFNYSPVGSPQSNRTILDVFQEISNTENGFVYANTAGAVVAEDRSTRYAQRSAIATIGNGPGQIHFEDIEYDYDPTYVYSQANLSRPANTAFAPQVNATSLANYGQRILSATLQVNNDFDLQQADTFYLNRYAAPGGAPGTATAPRIRKLVLNPAAQPGIWGFVLGLELSQRYTVTFATSAGVTITADYYVENIAETRSPAGGTYLVELQLSPVFVPTAWVLGDATYGVLGTSTVPIY